MTGTLGKHKGELDPVLKEYTVYLGVRSMHKSTNVRPTVSQEKYEESAEVRGDGLWLGNREELVKWQN